SADSSKNATATVTVLAAGSPTLTSIDPTSGAQGSAQQDVFLTGQNFATTDTVLVTPPSGQPATVVPTFISATLLRATIPSALLTRAGNVGIQVQRSNQSVSSTQGTLALSPVRPAIVALSPDNVSQSSTSVGVTLTGGFFSPLNTTLAFNGTSAPP